MTAKLQSLALATLVTLIALPLSGCVMVGGYRSGSGFFIWPGSFLFLAIALIFFLLRGRR